MTKVGVHHFCCITSKVRPPCYICGYPRPPVSLDGWCCVNLEEKLLRWCSRLWQIQITILPFDVLIVIVDDVGVIYFHKWTVRTVEVPLLCGRNFLSSLTFSIRKGWNYYCYKIKFGAALPDEGSFLALYKIGGRLYNIWCISKTRKLFIPINNILWLYYVLPPTAAVLK